VLRLPGNSNCLTPAGNNRNAPGTKLDRQYEEPTMNNVDEMVQVLLNRVAAG
jgi:hypothetical protein